MTLSSLKLNFILAGLACTSCFAPHFSSGQPSIDPKEANFKIRSLSPASGLAIGWEGLPYHYYFIEQSSDLISWGYKPVLEDGSDSPFEYGIDPTAPKYFYRVIITNDPSQEPLSLDFSGTGFTNWDFVRQGINPFDPQELLRRFVVVESWPTRSTVDSSDLLETDITIRLVGPAGFAMPNGQLTLSVESGPFELLDENSVQSSTVVLNSNTAGQVSTSLRLVDFYEGVGSVRITAGLDAGAPSLVLPIAVIAGAAPSTAQSLDATLLGADTVSLTWSDPIGGAVRYEVLRDGMPVGATEDLFYTDLLSGSWSTALYQITTVSFSGARSAVSSPIVVKALPVSGVAASLAPMLVSDNGLEVTISWGAAQSQSGIAGYHILQDGVIVATSPDNRWTFTNLQPAQNYSVTIQAIDQSGVVSADSAALLLTAATAPTLNLRAGGGLAYFFESGEGLFGFGNNTLAALGARYPDDAIGRGQTQKTPVSASLHPYVEDLAAGRFSSIIKGVNGSVTQVGFYQLLTGSEIASEYRSIDFTGIVIDKIGAGLQHFMGVDASNGSVYAWGVNAGRQLGYTTGGAVESITPSVVLLGTGLPLTGVSEVDGGNGFSVALMDDSTLRTWGLKTRLGHPDNSGNSNSWDHPLPVLLSNSQPLSNITAIAAGENHTLALASNGEVWSFGNNANFQLGHFSAFLGDQLVPDRVSKDQASGPILKDITHIAAGAAHSLALDVNGDVWSWGVSSYGQLGIAPQNSSPYAARKIPTLDSVTIVAIAASDLSSYAYGADGSIWAWGRNDHGQLGDGTTTDRHTPTRILIGAEHIVFTPYRLSPLGNSGVFISTARTGSTLRYTTDNTAVTTTSTQAVAGIALNPTPGTLIRARAYQNNLPVGEEFRWRMPSVLSGDAGEGIATHINSAGSLAAWGRPINHLPGSVVGVGQSLGDLENRSVRSVDVSGTSAQALTYDGKLFGWGDNAEGQLQMNGPSRLLSPAVDPAFFYKEIRSSSLSTLNETGFDGAHRLVLSDEIISSGINTSGQLGLSTAAAPIRALGPLEIPITQYPIEQVAVGTGVSFALDALGNTTAWGDLKLAGINTTALASEIQSGGSGPSRVAVANLAQITSNLQQVVGLKSDGTVWRWGVFAGTGGGGSTLKTVTQVETSASLPLDDIIAINAGRYHTLALRSDGTVWSWGRSAEGALGYADQADELARQIPSLSNIHWIAAGSDFSMAGDLSGAIWAWGRNTYGELGNLLLPSGATPVLVTIPSVPVSVPPSSGGSGNPPLNGAYVPPALVLPDSQPSVAPSILIEAPDDLEEVS
jgi:alpha-tubulin suppressor-like RCC1 family protein